MPNYEYRCPDGHLFDAIKSVDERDSAKCPEHGLTGKKVISRVNVGGPKAKDIASLKKNEIIFHAEQVGQQLKAALDHLDSARTSHKI